MDPRKLPPDGDARAAAALTCAAAVGLTILCLPTARAAQAVPDVSGIWVMDGSRGDTGGVYGQMRIVAQGPDRIEVTVLHYDPRGAITSAPWTFRVDRWGPRRGPEASSAPRTRARWMDGRLVLVKAPGEIGAALWIWSLAGGGEELVIDTMNPALSWDADLRAVGPTGRRYSHVFTKVKPGAACRDCFFQLHERRVTWDSAPRGEIALRLSQDEAVLEAMCLVARCTRVDLSGGRRVGARSMSRGDVTSLRASAEVRLEITARRGGAR